MATSGGGVTTTTSNIAEPVTAVTLCDSPLMGANHWSAPFSRNVVRVAAGAEDEKKKSTPLAHR